MKQKWHGVYLGMGSNLGKREKNFESALSYLSAEESIKVIKVSPVYDTKPVGDLPQGNFLNGVIYIHTRVKPLRLLQILKSIEQHLGRKNSKKRWGPRIIDLDILLFGDVIIQSRKLTIPHPLMHKRYFVLLPLLDIAQGLKHPVFRKTIKRLLAETAFTN